MFLLRNSRICRLFELTFCCYSEKADGKWISAPPLSPRPWHPSFPPSAGMIVRFIGWDPEMDLTDKTRRINPVIRHATGFSLISYQSPVYGNGRSNHPPPSPSDFPTHVLRQEDWCMIAGQISEDPFYAVLCFTIYVSFFWKFIINQCCTK